MQFSKWIGGNILCAPQFRSTFHNLGFSAAFLWPPEFPAFSTCESMPLQGKTSLISYVMRERHGDKKQGTVLENDPLREV